MFELLVAACGIKFLEQGWNPGPLHWEPGTLTTGPPGKSPKFSIFKWVLQGHAVIHSNIIPKYLQHPKRKPYVCSAATPRPPSSASGSHKPTLSVQICLSGCFLQMPSHNLCLLVPGFFLSVWCFWGASCYCLHWSLFPSCFHQLECWFQEGFLSIWLPTS